MEIKQSIIFSDKNNYLITGRKFFNVGIFLLPSAPILSAISLFISVVIGSINRKDNFFKDKWNYPLFATSLLMITGNVLRSFQLINNSVKIDNLNLWMDLFNWLPMFYIFWACKCYLIRPKDRETTIRIVLLSSVPVLISGILQYYYEIYGPFSIGNGIIIWYQRDISDQKSLTGLFNNANYAANWLSMIWTLSLTYTIQSFKSNLKPNWQKLILFIFNFLIGLNIILTNSRNGLLSMILFITIILVKTVNLKIFLIILFLFIPFILIFIYSPFFDIDSVPRLIKGKLQFSSITDLEKLPRFKIFQISLDQIFKNPIFGLGASSFPIIFALLGDRFKTNNIQHTHNLITEVAFNYGIFTSLLLFSTICYLIRKNWIKENKSNEDIGWICAASSILIFNFFDFTYYDARISLIFWILLSGLRASIAK